MLQFLIKVADVLTSETYREFNGMFKTGSYEYIIHFRIMYLFNMYSFVTHTKLPKVVRRVKHDGPCDSQYFHMPEMIRKK